MFDIQLMIVVAGSREFSLFIRSIDWAMECNHFDVFPSDEPNQNRVEQWTRLYAGKYLKRFESKVQFTVLCTYSSSAWIDTEKVWRCCCVDVFVWLTDWLADCVWRTILLDSYTIRHTHYKQTEQSTTRVYLELLNRYYSLWLSDWLFGHISPFTFGNNS